MITLQIAGNTPAEVAANVKGFFEQLLLSQVPADGRKEQYAAAADEAKAPVTIEGTATEVKDAPKAERKKRETKPKDDPKQVDLEEAIAGKADVKAPPVDDVRAALMKLSKAKGDDAVWNILEKYKAKSASTVPEDKRAELIADIEKECA